MKVDDVLLNIDDLAPRYSLTVFPSKLVVWIEEVYESHLHSIVLDF